MYFLPENSKRRENFIAGLTAGLVGVAMIAIAGKASAADPSTAHDHTTTPVTTVNKPAEEVRTDSAAHVHDAHADHESHQAQTGEASAHQGEEHDEHSKSSER
jgi:hypothetical protein